MLRNLGDGRYLARRERGSGNFKYSGPYEVKLGENSHMALAFQRRLSQDKLAEG